MLTLCYEIPSFDAMNARLIAEGKRNRWLFANPQKLGSHLMKNAQELYQKVACDRSVIKNSILAKLIKTLLPFGTRRRSQVSGQLPTSLYYCPVYWTACC